MTLKPIAITVQEAARISGFSRSGIYRALRSGELNAVKRGATTLVLMDSVDRLMSSLPAATFRQDQQAA